LTVHSTPPINPTLKLRAALKVILDVGYRNNSKNAKCKSRLHVLCIATATLWRSTHASAIKSLCYDIFQTVHISPQLITYCIMQSVFDRETFSDGLRVATGWGNNSENHSFLSHGTHRVLLHTLEPTPASYKGKSTFKTIKHRQLMQHALDGPHCPLIMFELQHVWHDEQVCTQLLSNIRSQKTLVVCVCAGVCVGGGTFKYSNFSM